MSWRYDNATHLSSMNFELEVNLGFHQMSVESNRAAIWRSVKRISLLCVDEIHIDTKLKWKICRLDIIVQLPQAFFARSRWTFPMPPYR